MFHDFADGFRLAFVSPRLAFRGGLMFHLGQRLGAALRRRVVTA